MGYIVEPVMGTCGCRLERVCPCRVRDSSGRKTGPVTIIYIVLSPIIYTRITRIVRFHISIGKLED